MTSHEQSPAGSTEAVKTARQLYETYKQELTAASMEEFGKSDIPTNLKTVSEDILSAYWAHGVTRGTDEQNLASLIAMLESGKLKGDEGALGKQDSFMRAWSTAHVLIVSLPEEHLIVRGSNVGGLADMKAGAYVLSHTYNPVIDELRKMFPDKNILRADELPSYLQQERK